MKARAFGFALAVVPSSALAQTCASYRPTWTGTDGAITALQELGYLMTSPVGVACAVLVAWHLVKPSKLARFVAMVVLVFAMLGEAETMLGAMTVPALAYSEGCRGAPWVTLPVLIALAGLVLWRRPAPRITSTGS